ncbi:glycoside hydrolase family 2 TIM barrel-domain containing protein [Rhodohalobacter sp.]|uniref:glycoside hydrolase family 2 TIM barrel-domain containing protein n=1 Tax=Rhodohalobacter sp. TaxID=1974210 RepID=UPI002ACD2C6E|nr:glycoside hydrolase family 2 TIM barrel-domain containing protein [Rhodohalobacter sp.]MDZ7758588.1 glycoside hydrolase family 2 TIM barrel-domain containing protein [Rhodohalobacter sp.]
MDRKEWLLKTSLYTAGSLVLVQNPLSRLLGRTKRVNEPIPVEIKEENGSFQMYRGGEPYYINGAGGGGHLELLASVGGNSIRRWSTGPDTMNLLDRAHRNGISVCLGLNMGSERHGFDYDDEEAVASQLERMRGEVLKYKDHPAVLVWGIGNELNLNYTNTNMWHAVNDVSKMIHEEDPYHLTTTMMAGINQERIDHIKEKCSDLDLLSINTYGSLPLLPENIRKFGWNKAYIVTEWGPTGHWESPRTEWDVAIEETSTVKAELYKDRYQASMGSDSAKCLGSYVFLWGQKQERTHTWYGMFLENGDPIEVVDSMQYNWTGKWPEKRSPGIDDYRLDGKTALESVYLKAGQQVEAEVFPINRSSGNIAVEWEVFHESTDLQLGGDREEKPPKVEGVLSRGGGTTVRLNAPEKEGAYRIFVYLEDEDINRVATANIPFYVRD